MTLDERFPIGCDCHVLGKRNRVVSVCARHEYAAQVFDEREAALFAAKEALQSVRRYGIAASRSVRAAAVSKINDALGLMP